MYAQDFAVNYGSNAKVVENARTVLPWVSIAIFSHSFVIEAINSRDLSRFMIAPQQSDRLGIFEL